MPRHLAVLASLALLLSACATVSSTPVSGASVPSAPALKTFYVVQLEADKRGVNAEIVSQLNARGFQATTGLDSQSPAPVDAIVTYEDHWAWDMAPYMIRLRMEIRDGRTGELLGQAESYRPSLQRKTIGGMVQEVLQALFK